MKSLFNSESESVSLSEAKQAFETQCRVIYALIMRETKSRYGDYKLGFLWAIMGPLFMMVMFGAFFVLSSRGGPSGMRLELFLLTGVVPFFMFRNIMNEVSNAIKANKSLLAFPQVTTLDVVIARALLELATYIVIFVVLLLGIIASGVKVDVENSLAFFAAVLLLFNTGLGMGLIFSSLTPFMPSLTQITDLLLGRPLMMTSGLFFTMDQLPPMAREIVSYNPILHMVELCRSMFFKSYDSQYMDVEYAFIFSLLLIWIGLLMHRALHKKAAGL